MKNDPCDQRRRKADRSRTGFHRNVSEIFTLQKHSQSFVCFYSSFLKSVLEREQCTHLDNYCDVTEHQKSTNKEKDGAMTEYDNTSYTIYRTFE